MNTQQAYDIWSEIYDTNINKTRDLEAAAIREVLSKIHFDNCLEIGCGTGKNTDWLIRKADKVIGIDLSESMLTRAKEKIKAPNIAFKQADITKEWDFASAGFDLITFSLMLEHIEDLFDVFKKASSSLLPGGYVYVGELHPFKHYSGSKARFDTESGQQVVPCFNHHVSDFVQAAKENGLIILELNEYFDNNDRSSIPRILYLAPEKK